MNPPRLLVIGLGPLDFNQVNTKLIEDYGKWFNLYDYASADIFFHAVQLWVLDARIGPRYCIIESENVSLPIRKTPKGTYNLLSPTNEQINAIIQTKPPEANG